MCNLFRPLCRSPFPSDRDRHHGLCSVLCALWPVACGLKKFPQVPRRSPFCLQSGTSRGPARPGTIPLKVRLPILHVGETHTDFTRWQLVDLDNSQLHIVLAGSDNLPAVQQALAPVVTACARVHNLDTQIAAKQKDIDRVEADSARLHTNIQGLKDSAEERTLANRYAGELNADEDQLQTLRKDRADLEQQREAAQQALNDAIRNLSLDLDV